MIHLDHTRAVTPLDAQAHWGGNEPPETYPSGL